MSHPLDYETNPEKYSPSFIKCEHGVYLASSCSICRSTVPAKCFDKSVSKTKVQKIERQLPKQIEDKIIETCVREIDEHEDDPRELGEEIEQTNVVEEITTAEEGLEATA